MPFSTGGKIALMLASRLPGDPAGAAHPTQSLLNNPG